MDSVRYVDPSGDDDDVGACGGGDPCEVKLNPWMLGLLSAVPCLLLQPQIRLGQVAHGEGFNHRWFMELEKLLDRVGPSQPPRLVLNGLCGDRACGFYDDGACGVYQQRVLLRHSALRL